MHINLKKAISFMIFQEPFIGSLLPRLPIRSDSSIQTMATNGKAIFYNPDYVAGQDIRILRADVAHEIFHCIMLHMYRRGTRHPEKWNYAADYAINPLVKELKDVYVDETFLYDPVRFSYGMTAEEIYDQLDDDEIPQDFVTDLLPADGDKSEQASQQMEWKGAIAVAAHNAKKAGKLSSAVESLIENLLEPKVSWEHQLYLWMKRPSGRRSSVTKTNRHYRAHGINLPGKIRTRSGKFILVYDVSGSMSDQAVRDSLSEVRYIINEIQPISVILIEHDTEITAVQEFYSGDELPTEITLHGRGGTDFNPVFNYIHEEMYDIPDAVIFFTDGEGPHPEIPPEYPVLWVMVETSPDTEMNFGEQIWLDP